MHDTTQCFHCGDAFTTVKIEHNNKFFCCHGCQTVYDILNESNLTYYYDLDKNPGTSPSRFEGKFDFLENERIVQQLLAFDENNVQVVSFTIPAIHCSSCIWVLENLHKLQPAVQSVQVNFPKKTARITYNSEQATLHQIVLLLCSIGYEPYISLDDSTKKSSNIDRSLIYKLGVAGFAFGNIMFLSFPEYFEVSEFWLDQFKPLFRWLMFAFALPVVFYAAQDYMVSAFKSLRAKMLNIDVPIALGILVLFLRSTIEIVMDWGTGFFDSLSGLVFFLLLGKFFQQKTYSYLSFERDYKSYFPIAVTKLSNHTEEQTQVNDLLPGDRILIRNGELLPVDGILIRGNALIDYSFVTGEAEPVVKTSGDTLYAGGKQQAGVLEVEVIKSVTQSYLTQLWSNDVFAKHRVPFYKSITDTVSQHFTVSLLIIALLATTFWIYYEPSLALNVFTAVLIVACPCAIALAAPFTLGNMLRIFGRHKFYVKNSAVIERLTEIDTIVFDKTGTLTSHQKGMVSYEGVELTPSESSLLTATLRASNHPLSRSIYELLKEKEIYTLDEFDEEIGQGITGRKASHKIKVGSFPFVSDKSSSRTTNTSANRTAVHLSSDDEYKGCFVFYNEYRNGVQSIFETLAASNSLVVLSGDNEGEKKYLAALLPPKTQLVFNQKPNDKLNFIKNLQEQGKKVLMVGDGLNDAGALAQSDVGIAISENVNVFSPACDGILDASRFTDFVQFISLSHKAKAVIKYAFIFSLFYNVIGLGFAISGQLTPVVAAILMPLSSISIVIFTTLYTYFLGKKLSASNQNQYG
ncbi:MAG: heavy metal translocating P-type ATPase metal-binding domain-containing protein [Marinirhabdus sp.]|nr:heavy metal translocating P-type ATPase metal-binding domain-containing protein [Marinirhabdus sp.]